MRNRLQQVAVVIGLCLAVCSAQSPGSESGTNPDRQQAIQLYKEGKFVEAMPIFERLASEYPTDFVLREGWAWCVLQSSSTITNPAERKKVRAHARAIAVQARDLGDTSQLLQVILELPEDGSGAPTFSDHKEVDEIIKTAEANFSRGELEKARQGYLQAWLLEPRNYNVALFIGDVYFKQQAYASAGEWFYQAIQIDPDRETAYRYWGDALMAMGKMDDARSKYIEAIVAEPYTRRTWVGLTNWLQKTGLQLNQVELKDRAVVTSNDAGNVNLTVDNSFVKNDPNETAWLSYGLERASWKGGKFKKEFPAETQYRRTLKEESDCLTLMLTVLNEQKDAKKNSLKLDPALKALVKIQQAGFIEPFVLLNRADADIAKDYEPYRAQHRENIRRYLDEFAVPKTPSSLPKE